uniref:Uncharacterized protein n=1 Tax=Rhizophora mucronata TaxID=61149 RepID=A0A2P2JEC4_RHIMU
MEAHFIQMDSMPTGSCILQLTPLKETKSLPSLRKPDSMASH